MECNDCERTFETERDLRVHQSDECPQKCVACGREGLRGNDGLHIHSSQDCPVLVLGAGPASESAEAAVDVVAKAAEQQPAAILTPPEPSYRVQSPPAARLPESVRDPAGRPNYTHAWYGFVPSEADISGISTTGLPDDILHSAPSWQPHEVQSQIAQGHVLLTPVERYGGIVRGSPFVHVQPPVRTTWDAFAERWRALLPQEIDIERDLLEQAEMDLNRATTRDERALARQRIRIFSTRVYQLEHLAFESIWRFLVREHEFSLAVGRSSTRVLEDQIDARIDEKLIEKELAAHVG